MGGGSLRSCVVIALVAVTLVAGPTSAGAAVTRSATPSATTAGTNIGNAAQITSTASGTLTGGTSDDWWVIYPATLGGTVAVQVDNTTSTPTNCGGVLAVLDASNGSSSTLQSKGVAASTSASLSGSLVDSDRYFVEVSIL